MTSKPCKPAPPTPTPAGLLTRYTLLLERLGIGGVGSEIERCPLTRCQALLSAKRLMQNRALIKSKKCVFSGQEVAHVQVGVAKSQACGGRRTSVTEIHAVAPLPAPLPRSHKQLILTCGGQQRWVCIDISSDGLLQRASPSKEPLRYSCRLTPLSAHLRIRS